MKKTVLEWVDASKRIPEAKDYNKDGIVIVAYENGVVSRGYVKINGEWAYKDRNGKAMFWAPYPEHPNKEEARCMNV